MSARVPKMDIHNNEAIIISLNLAYKSKKEESIWNHLNAIYFKSITVTNIFVIPITVDCKKLLQLWGNNAAAMRLSMSDIYWADKANRDASIILIVVFILQSYG